MKNEPVPDFTDWNKIETLPEFQKFYHSFILHKLLLILRPGEHEKFEVGGEVSEEYEKLRAQLNEMDTGSLLKQLEEKGGDNRASLEEEARKEWRQYNRFVGQYGDTIGAVVEKIAKGELPEEPTADELKDALRQALSKKRKLN